MSTGQNTENNHSVFYVNFLLTCKSDLTDEFYSSVAVFSVSLNFMVQMLVTHCSRCWLARRKKEGLSNHHTSCVRCVSQTVGAVGMPFHS